MLQTAERTITKIEPIGMLIAPEVKKTRIAPYCRVSTDSNDQEHSFAAQVKYYTDEIKRIPNSELVDIYADDGISGRGKKKRDDFNRLIADCKKGKIDRVITKSVSRFARNTVDCLETVRLLSSYGVSILFEKEGLDTATMSSEVLLAMSGTQAQDESVSHGNNMRWSYQERMKKGNFIGTVATYGYTLINSGEEIINEAEAQVVRMMKDMYLSGWGLQKIADYLNDNGIKRRKGKPWNAMSVRYVLTNERYVGDALLQKTITTYENPPRRMVNDGSQPMYYVENCVPAIFSREDRQAILTLLESRGIKGGKKGGHALSRMLRCSDCGNAYRRLKQKNSVVWKCAFKNAGRTDCEVQVIQEDDACQAFIDTINKLYTNRATLIAPLIERMELLHSKVNGTEIRLRTIDKEIAELSRQSLVISELMKKGILESSDFYSQYNELSARISELRIKRRECLNENDTDEVIKSLRQLDDMLEDMESELTDYDEDIIRAIIRDATVISNTELRINLRCGLTVTEHLPQYYSRRCKQ